MVWNVAYSTSIDTLIQYDLSSGDPLIIRGSRQNIYISQFGLENQFGGMLTGPDGKIYIANFDLPYLSSIEKPDILGPGCDFNNKAINLSRGNCFVGLPTFPAGIYTPGKPWLQGPTILCDTMKEAKYFVSGNCRYQDYDWHLSGTSSVLRTDGDTVWIKPGNSGFDQLTVIKHTACSTLFDTLNFAIEPCDTSTSPCTIPFSWSDADTLICFGEDAWLRFNTSAEFVKYKLASDGIFRTAESSTITFPNLHANDQVTIFFQSLSGCDTQIVVNIRVNPPLVFNFLSLDSIVCSGEIASINLQTNPLNLVEIFPENLGFVITNPFWPVSIGPLNSDSILYVRVRDQIMGCDSVFKWQIRTESEEKLHKDTIQMCIGDSLNVFGIWFYKDTLVSETILLPGCDSVSYVEINHYPVIHVNLETINPCKINNGSISIASISGPPPYLYSINSNPLQSIPVFNHLSAGDYLIKITDGLGCQFDTLITLTEINGLNGIKSEVIDAHCNENNGSIVVHTGQQNDLFSLNNGSPQIDSIFLGLANGNYNIITMNAVGCSDTSQATINQTGNPLISNVISLPSHCNQNDGVLNIEGVIGGVAPYYFQLGNSPISDSSRFQGLSSGNYIAYVVDFDGCKDSISAVVEDEEAPIISSIDIIPAYCGLSEGALSVKVISLSTLTYKLDQLTSYDGQFRNLHAGNFQLQIIDTFGCIVLKDISIPDSISFIIQDIKITSAGCNEKGGTIDVFYTGNDIHISVEELPGQEWTSTIRDLPGGTYHLKIKDVLNCFVDTTILVSQNCQIELPNIFSPNGDLTNDIFGAINNIDFTTWQLSIFDRSGNMVFYSIDPRNGWDGTFRGLPSQVGVYVWMLVYKIDGQLSQSIQKGDITLIR